MVLRTFALWVLAICLSSTTAFAAALLFNANNPADNATQRTAWLAAIGSAPTNLVNFEFGFVDGQNIDGTNLGAGFFLNDTGPANAVFIECGAGSIGGSNPIGTCAAEHNEAQFLVFDFSASPVDYVAFYDIDHTAVTNGSTIFFVGGASQTFTLEGTGSGAGTEEFFGIFRNDMPQIERIQLDVGGDGQWAVDDIEYGPTAIPEPATFLLAGTGLALAILRRRRA